MPDFQLTPDPSPEDAAALIAAVERFLADTTVPAIDAQETVSGWLRAALAEGVGDRDEHSIW